MRNRYQNFLLILLAGGVVGVLFAILTKDIETSPQLLIALATVQGSFLAIVLSVFLLSLQVNATEFSPLTLEDSGGVTILSGLVLLYVFSILLDLLYLLTLSDPLFVIHTNLNLSAGIPTGVATICLLMLLPIQGIMADRVTPESVLKSASQNAKGQKLIEGKSQRDLSPKASISPPQRTPLLTIEQILLSAHQRGSEFTIRQSIYYMYDTIATHLDDIETENVQTSRGQVEYSGGIRDRAFTHIFDYWDTCLQIGTEGGAKRVNFLHSTHTKLIYKLIPLNKPTLVNKRLEELTEIHLSAFESEYTEPELLDVYPEILTSVLENKERDLVEPILSSVLSVCDEIITGKKSSADYGDYLAGEKRDVIASGFCILVDCIEIIAESENADDHLLRRVTNNGLNRLDSVLLNLFESLEAHDLEGPEIAAIKQNVISELQNSLLSSLSTIYSEDQVVGKNLTIVVMELSLWQGQDPSEFARSIRESTNEDDLATQIVQEVDDVEQVLSLKQLNIVADNELEDFAHQLS